MTLITIVACVCLTMQIANGQTNVKTVAMKQKALQMLKRLKDATPVAPKDNLMELSIDTIIKSGDEYKVCLKGIAGQRERVTNIYFIDPENYKNNEQPGVIVQDGKKYSSMTVDGKGNVIHTVKIRPASKLVYVYFSGFDDYEKTRTVPLFFTIALGDDPFIIEQTPRYAGTLFDEALKQE